MLAFFNESLIPVVMGADLLLLPLGIVLAFVMFMEAKDAVNVEEKRKSQQIAWFCLVAPVVIFMCLLTFVAWVNFFAALFGF